MKMTLFDLPEGVVIRGSTWNNNPLPNPPGAHVVLKQTGSELPPRQWPERATLGPMLACRLATLLLALPLACATPSAAPASTAPAALSAPVSAADVGFVTVPLGTAGGLDEGNLSSYLLSVRGDGRWVALDAGTLHGGLRAAVARGALPGGPGPRRGRSTRR